MQKKGFEFLSHLLEAKSVSQTELAAQLEVTAQALSNWKTSNEIPTKRVSQIANYFKLTGKDVDLLLGNTPLQFEFRTKNGDELSQNRVSESTKVRAEMIFERFFNGYEQAKDYDLSKLRNKIQSIGNKPLEIANAIREEFTIPNYRPLGHADLGALVERVRVRSYFLPFSSISLSENGNENSQTAILYNKDEHYVILIDSDRMIDEAHFDQLHELIHIFLHNVDLKIDENTLEALIDKICGELIYPQIYIVDRFFRGDQNSKPITNKEYLVASFWEDTLGQTYALSPKGLAKAMRDASLTTVNSELYKYLSTELHDSFRKSCINYSAYGHMNINFSDLKEVLDFYKYIEAEIRKTKYPLFQKIKKDLLSEEISSADFADTFSMKLEDALLIKAVWMQELQSRASK